MPDSPSPVEDGREPMTNPPSVSGPAGEALFTDEHRAAIGLACEKLWNDEPPDDPTHSPRPASHPLVLVANRALAALNAMEAEIVRYEKRLSALTTRLSSLKQENGELKAARDQLRASLGIHVQTIGGELSSLSSSSERS